MNRFTKTFVAAAVALLVFGCSGTPNSSQTGSSSSSSSSTTGSYTIGGTVTGLTGSGLVLQDNSGDNLTITASGAFTFKTSIVSGKTYSVSVFAQPTSPAQTCVVTAGSGTTTANVTTVQVACGTNTVSIGLTVTGLAGTGLVLQDNGGDNLTVNQNGVYTFATAIPTGTAYKVTVLTQPTVPAQICSVASGTGTANANVGNIVVTCSTPTISIGGSVTGLDGTGLVLQDNGGNNLTVSANGSFTFSSLIVSGTSYNVTVLTQPSSPAQTCTVTGGSGTTTSNVTTVQVLCPAVFFPVGGQVVGLVGNGGNPVLQNKGGDNLPLSGDGPFTFVTQIAYGGQFDVFMLVPPMGTQPQPCVLWGYQGVVTGPVNSVLVDCGHNDWNWMDGSNSSNANGTTSTPPTPTVTALDTSTPGGRKYAATWVDNSGNLWLFGGLGWDIPTTSESIFLNDIWEYSGTQSYYGGYNNNASTYWVQVQPNEPVTPAPVQRWGVVTWKDSSGRLLLFGGQYGTLGGGGIGFMNDVWRFDTSSSMWTQLSSSNAACNANFGINNNGVYGTKGTPSANNCPGSRWGAAFSSDASGDLWMFGGFGYDAASATPGLLDDLWEYTTSGQWVWVSGSNTINADGVYGTKGTASLSNVPGGRQASSAWVDSSGNFWLFGGYNLSPGGQPDGFNDLWEYSSGQWTWVSGSNNVNQTGVYGVEGTAAAANVPGARWGSASWIDAAGRLWLFGGEGYDTTANGSLADLWQFSSGQWTWVKGPNSVGQVGVYGAAPSQTDLPHVINYPGSRLFPAYWNDLNGYFWMFGGEGYDATTASDGLGLLNDLWRYLPFP
jgi:hypothetical protein